MKWKKLFRLNRKLLIVVIAATFVTTLLISQKSVRQISQPYEDKTDSIRAIANDINNSCTVKNSKCYQDSIEQKLLSRYSTLEILDAVYDYDKYFSCHAFTHFLGRAIYQQTQNIPDSYSKINFTCHGGAYHGVMEGFMEKSGWQTDLESIDLENICKSSNEKTTLNADAVFSECLHGFGHAFMFVTTSNLPASLALCDRLPQGLDERCYGGVFMENSTSSTSAHPTQWLKPDDKFYPCTVLGEKYLNQCYFYQANYLIMSSDHNFQKVFGDCYTLSGKALDYCLTGIGAILASVSNEKGIKTAAEVCSLGNTNRVKTICIEGAVPSLLQRYGGQTEKIIEFCSQVETGIQNVCFAKLGKRLSIWNSGEQIDSICKNTNGFYNACIGKLEVKLYFEK